MSKSRLRTAFILLLTFIFPLHNQAQVLTATPITGAMTTAVAMYRQFIKVMNVTEVGPVGGSTHPTISFGLSPNGNWAGGVHNNGGFTSTLNIFTPLSPYIGSPVSASLGINNIGNTVGSEGSSICSSGVFQSFFSPYLFFGSTNTVQFLDVILNSQFPYSGLARSVNDSNQSVGVLYMTNSCTSQAEGVLWNQPTSAPTALNLIPYKINNVGQILGSRPGTAFVISNGSTEQVISLPAGYTSILPNDISDSNRVTGVAYPVTGNPQQFTWYNGSFTFLSSFVPYAGSILHNGKINAQGITGGGLSEGGVSHAYIRLHNSKLPIKVKSLLNHLPVYANYDFQTVTGVSDLTTRNVFSALVNVNDNGQQRVLKITFRIY